VFSLQFGFVLLGTSESKGFISFVLASFFYGKSILKDLLASFWPRSRCHAIDYKTLDWVGLTFFSVFADRLPPAMNAHQLSLPSVASLYPSICGYPPILNRRKVHELIFLRRESLCSRLSLFSCPSRPEPRALLLLTRRPEFSCFRLFSPPPAPPKPPGSCSLLRH